MQKRFGLYLIAYLAGVASAGAQDFRAPGEGADWSGLDDVARYHVEETEYQLEAGNLDAASLEIQQAISLVPDNPTLLMWAGDLYLRRRQYSLSESYWARLAEMFPTNALVLSRWGGVLYRMNRLDEARKIMRQALEVYPDNMPVRFHLACLELAQGKVQEMENLLRDLTLADITAMTGWIRDDPQWLQMLLRPEQLRLLCEWILRGGRPPESTAPLKTLSTQEALERISKAAGAFRNTQLAIKNGDWTNALAALNVVAETGVTAPHVRLLHAVARFQVGEKEQAYQDMTNLLHQAPDTPRAQYTYGLWLLEDRRFPEAVKVLASAVRTNPADAEPVFALMCAHAAQGQFTDTRTLARGLSPEQSKRIAEWMTEEDSLSRYLKTNAEMFDWVQKTIREKANTPTNETPKVATVSPTEIPAAKSAAEGK